MPFKIIASPRREELSLLERVALLERNVIDLRNELRRVVEESKKKEKEKEEEGS